MSSQDKIDIEVMAVRVLYLRNQGLPAVVSKPVLRWLCGRSYIVEWQNGNISVTDAGESYLLDSLSNPEIAKATDVAKWKDEARTGMTEAGKPTGIQARSSQQPI